MDKWPVMAATPNVYGTSSAAATIAHLLVVNPCPDANVE